MKVWISKYALSAGVQEVECGDITDGCAYSPYGGCNWLKMGIDAHDSREEAVAKAEKDRIKKIASLEKQIKKLKAKTF